MLQRLLHVLYAIEFLIALIAVYTVWGQVGGQNHLDYMAPVDRLDQVWLRRPVAVSYQGVITNGIKTVGASPIFEQITRTSIQISLFCIVLRHKYFLQGLYVLYCRSFRDLPGARNGKLQTTVIRKVVIIRHYGDRYPCPMSPRIRTLFSPFLEQ